MWGVVFGIAAVGVGIGMAIFLFVVLPQFIYILPYITWLGWNSGTKGIPKKHESDSLPPWEWLTFSVKNASKLYRSWITKQPHGITKF